MLRVSAPVIGDVEIGEEGSVWMTAVASIRGYADSDVRSRLDYQ